MDFEKFDARAAATAGAALHLKHPSTGEPIWADPAAKGGADSLPCRVLVIGSESPQAQAALREIQKRKMTGAKKKGDDDVRFFTDLHTELVEVVKPLIIGFENIDRGKAPATLSDVEWFLNLQTINGSENELSFAEQISNFARKRANFLGNASNG